MKIQCDNCAIQHELDPPSWVVSSGRAFRFRCSSCGHSQSVQPTPDAEPEEASEPETAPPQNPEDPPDRPPVASEATSKASPEAPPDDLPEGPEGAVFLKQNGQIYMVRDWHTLTRWIQERRVDRHDLVSEGGVRWQPIGSHEDLVKYFVDTLAPAAQRSSSPASLPPEASDAQAPDLPELPEVPEPSFSEAQAAYDPQVNTPFAPTAPLGGETPFLGGGTVSPGHWHDDDTEGIPTGLPLLPTEEGGEEAFDEPFGENPSFSLPPPSAQPFSDPGPVMGELPPPDLSGAFPDIDDSPAPDAPPPLPALTPFSVEPASDWNDLMVEDEAPLEPPSSALSDVPDEDEEDEEEEEEEEDDDLGFMGDFKDSPNIASFNSGAASGVPADEPDGWDDFSPSAAESPPLTTAQKVGLSATTVALILVLLVLANWMISGPPNSPPEPDETNIADVIPRPQPTISAEAPDDPIEPPEDLTPEQPTAQPEPIEVPAPVPAPVPTPVQTARPKPPPAPSPAPPPRPKQPSLSALVDNGWNTIDDDPAAAAIFFKQALAVSSSHALANEGYGYAKLKLGDAATGKKHLCKAMVSGDTETKAEVKGILGQFKLTCP